MAPIHLIQLNARSSAVCVCLSALDGGARGEDVMIEIVEILRQEHRNLEKLLRVMEQELRVFDRGESPDYEVFGAIIEFFKKYPDSCHHPKEDIIYEKFKARAPDRAASISDLQAEHREGAVRLRRVAQAIENVLDDQEVLREDVDRIVRDFIEARTAEMFAIDSAHASVAVANPLSGKFDTLRPLVLPGLVDAVAHNRHHGRRDVRVFELGTRFGATGESR